MMDRKTANKYLQILQISQSDSKYLEYYHSYQALNEDMRVLFKGLTFEDAVLIADYFGLREAMENRLLEIACEQMDFS